MEKDQMQEIYAEFKQTVNMTALALEKWLDTDESKSVGWDSGDGSGAKARQSKDSNWDYSLKNWGHDYSK